MAWRWCFRAISPCETLSRSSRKNVHGSSGRSAGCGSPRPNFRPPGCVTEARFRTSGERLSLRVRVERSRSRAHVSRRGSELTVKLGPENALPDALEAWYRRQARLEVAPRLDAAVARAGRSYERLQIRGQRTRWASCSTSGAMSFNWRLLLAPAEILDYVVEHEVAHLDVQDHSQRFWRLLGSRCPRWREHEAWLRPPRALACAYSQRKKRTARNSPAAAQAPTTSAAVPSVAASAHDRRREPVDQVLERQRLGDRLEGLGQVVGRVEDARDEDQRAGRWRSCRPARTPRSGSRARRRRRAPRSRPRPAA